MSKEQLSRKNPDTIIRKARKYGDYLTYGAGGAGIILMLYPPTAALGLSLVGGAALDKSMDLTIGKEVERGYNKLRGNLVQQTDWVAPPGSSIPQSGRVYNFVPPQQTKRAA